MARTPIPNEQAGGHRGLVDEFRATCARVATHARQTAALLADPLYDPSRVSPKAWDDLVAAQTAIAAILATRTAPRPPKGRGSKPMP